MTPSLRGSVADVVTCLAFFSRLPLPATARGDDRGFAQAIGMLPIAGLVIGAAGALPLMLGALAGLPPAMAALLGTGAGVLVTGGLHEDGLADSADGLGGGATRERKLVIMRDSRIGTYGVLALILALGLRTGALATLLDRAAPLAVAALMLAAAALSRALCLLPLALLPPARPDGLGRGVGSLDRIALVTSFAAASFIGVGLPALAGAGVGHALLGCGLATLAALAVTRLARHHLGGHTGDIAGAAQQAAEAAFYLGLLLLPARP